MTTTAANENGVSNALVFLFHSGRGTFLVARLPTERRIGLFHTSGGGEGNDCFRYRCIFHYALLVFGENGVAWRGGGGVEVHAFAVCYWWFPSSVQALRGASFKGRQRAVRKNGRIDQKQMA